MTWRITTVLCSLFLALSGCASDEIVEKSVADEGSLENGEFSASLNGFKIHYKIYGNGPACIVLTNSWGFTSDGVRALFRSLEDHLTMVYFDPRGMGRSDAVRQDSDMSMKAVREDANALRTHLGLDDAIFLGWSNGAMNLLIFAAEYPETVNAAIIVHGVAYSSEVDIRSMMENYPDFELYAKFASEIGTEESPTEDKTARLKSYLIENWLPALFADSERGKETSEKLFRDIEFSWRHMEYSNVDHRDFDARQNLALIKAPSLVLAGANDMFPPHKVKATADAILNSTFVVFENSGHFASIEEPEKFLSTVTKFLGLSN